MHYNGYQEGSKVGKPETLEVDVVIGGDGANSRVAREMNAGEYDYAIAFQVRQSCGAAECRLCLTCSRLQAALTLADSAPAGKQRQSAGRLNVSQPSCSLPTEQHTDGQHDAAIQARLSPMLS